MYGRRFSRGIWAFQLSVGVAVLLVALVATTGLGQDPLPLEGRFCCSVLRVVRFRFGGVVDEVTGVVGQVVTNGQPLVRYRLFPDAAQELFRRLNPTRVHDLELEASRTENRLSDLTARLDEARKLLKESLSSEAEIGRLEREVKTLKKQADLLRSRAKTEKRLAEKDAGMLRRLLAAPLPKDVIPSKVWLTTPLDGRLLSVQPGVRPGAEVVQFGEALQVGVMDPMILRAQVHEREVVHLKKGDPARVTAVSLPGRVFTGRLSRISWAPAIRGLEEPAYFDIEVTVPNPDLNLKDGFKARLEFPVQPRVRAGD